MDQLGNTSTRSDVDYDVDGDDATDVEEWWPARSRRPTVGEEDRPDQGYRSTSELMSPNSPVSATATEHDTLGGREGKESSGEIPGVWGLLKDEMGAEDWEGWIADGKWSVHCLAICFFQLIVHIGNVSPTSSQFLWL